MADQDRLKTFRFKLGTTRLCNLVEGLLDRSQWLGEGFIQIIWYVPVKMVLFPQVRNRF